MDILKCLCMSTPFHPHGTCVWGDIPDEVWISLVKRAQLPPVPLLESTASSCMVTGVVPATTPPTLKLGIIECNVLKQNGVNDSFLLNIPLLRFLLFCCVLVVAQGRPYMLFWGLAVVIGFYSSG